MNWLRWYHGTSSDPKWRLIAKEVRMPVALVVAVWATMLENASENTRKRGTLNGWKPENIAAGLDLETEQVLKIFTAMEKKVREGQKLTAWRKRNPKREDGSAERAKAWRESQKENKTQPNAGERNRTPEEKRRDKKREEKKEGKHARADARRVPFKEFMFAELRAVGVEPVTDESDWTHYEKFLTKTDGNPAFTEEKLREYFGRFVRDPSDFIRRQGHPIRYFCTNVSGFMREASHAPGNYSRPAPQNRRDPGYTPKQQ